MYTNFNPSFTRNTWNAIFIHNKPYTTNVKIFRHNMLVTCYILHVINYSLMDCKEIVKCIKFLLHPYKYINIIMFIT